MIPMIHAGVSSMEWTKGLLEYKSIIRKGCKERMTFFEVFIFIFIFIF